MKRVDFQHPEAAIVAKEPFRHRVPTHVVTFSAIICALLAYLACEKLLLGLW